MTTTSDFSKPVITDAYTSVLPEISAINRDLALGLDPAYTSPANVPTNATRWNSVNKYWEKYGGTTWTALCSLYAITVAAAVKWANAITLSVTGDATGAVSIDGGSNATIALTLATVNQSVGTFGDQSDIPVITVNAKGQVTNVGTVSVSAGLPAGAIATWAASVAPTGYLECNGALLSRTTYASLFAAIGTTFGVGDGSTTFGIPDLRGYFPRGWDHGRGVDSGRAFGSSQSDLFASHNHNTSPYFNAINFSRAAWDPTGVGFMTNELGGTYGNDSYTGGAETRPKNIALMFIIKY